MKVLGNTFFENMNINTIAVTGVSGGILGLYFIRKYFAGGVCTSTATLHGKVVVITGANTGIGYETAKDLAKRGATVVLACRNVQLAQKAADEIKNFSLNNNVVVMSLDLSSLASVRAFSSQYKSKFNQLDILINNAGVMACPKSQTEDGLEMQIGVNHFGHFLLTNLLLDLLKKSAPSRIVNVSSRAHIRGNIDFDDINSEKVYTPFGAYSQSKLANVLFTKELAERLKGSRVTVVSLHPGVVHTELLRHQPSFLQFFLVPFQLLFFKRQWQGAQTTIHCAVDSSVPAHSGAYFSDCAVKKTAPQGENMEDARRLWELSERIVGLKK